MTTRSASASERPQFVPTAATPSGTTAATASVGLSPIIVRVPMSNENETTSGRSVDALDPLDRPHGLLDGEDRLEHEQVDAAVGERLRLLGVGRDRVLAVEQPVRLDQLPRRPERARHEPIRRRRPRARARRRGGSPRAARPASGPSASRSGVAPNVQVRTMSAPAVGERAVQLDDPLGRLEQPLLGCETGLHAHRLVVRARRAVGDQHAPLRQQVCE